VCGAAALLAVLSASAVYGQKLVSVALKSSAENGLVEPGEPVAITATIVNRGGSHATVRVDWSVETVAFKPPPVKTVELSVDAGESKSISYESALATPGFATVVCAVTSTNLAVDITRRFRFGCRPEKIAVPLTKQADFDAFWRTSLDALKKVDPEFQVERRADRDMEGIRVFEVTMKSLGGVRVRGWLETPASPGPHPVVLRVPGYGGNMRPVGKWKDMIVFSFNPRGHGNSQDDVPGKPVDYWIRGLDDKSTYYYRGAYLDCVRAVDFIASRQDAARDRIAVWGGSQGGGFALATAALDQRIDYCVADIPFMCDWRNYFELTDWPEMNDWIADREDRTWKSTLRTLGYFDTLNLAERIECSTIMSIGLQDRVCPPTTDFAVFNRIDAKKTHKIYPTRGHGLGREHYDWVWRQLRTAFELDK
jgi:cephalosporin-C deacetylase-like acetyl esterase